MPESVFLVQISEDPATWELRDVIPLVSCFSRGYKPDDKAMASGTLQACEAAARLMGYHIDRIFPILPKPSLPANTVLVWPYAVRR